LFTDLIKRLLHLIDPINNEKFIPIPQSLNCMVNEVTPNAFEDIMTKGIATIQIIPNAEIKGNDLHIYGRNPLYGFSKLLSFLEKYEETNKQPYCDVLDLSADDNLHVRITPSNRKSIDNVFIQKIGELIKCNVNVLCNFVNEEGFVETYPLDTIILNSFNKWKRAWLQKLYNELELLNKKLLELNAITIIREILKNNPLIKTVDEIIEIFKNSNVIVYGVTADIIRETASKHRIKTLIEKDINISEVVNEIKQVENSINKHDEIVLERLKSYV
jgi:hypothetical protein